MLNTFVITIDGPAGVGKSTLAKKLATYLNVPMLDTGAMYRTLGLKLGAEVLDYDDEKTEKKAKEYVFSLNSNTYDAELMCNNELVSSLPIRTDKAARMSSIVAKLPAIRKVLQEDQQKIAENFSIVVEGRDMGTKVFPMANCKIFLDANAKVRTQRRFDELKAKGENPDFDELFEALAQRDLQDRTREVDPLKAAEDAIIIDTSDKNLEEVFALLKKYAEEKLEQITENFTHLDSDGNACMVDVSGKKVTKRIAIVGCTVEVSANTLSLLKENALPKGDVLTTAKIAGILAAKQTSALIPMCHPLAITYADIRFKVIDLPPSIEIEAEVHTDDKTGVEMEAIIAAQVTAATIYDMCKAVQKDICINECRLLRKTGGKTDYTFNGR